MVGAPLVFQNTSTHCLCLCLCLCRSIVPVLLRRQAI